MSKPTQKHLLIPGEFRIVCQPHGTADGKDVTTHPAQVTCANCASMWRTRKTGRNSRVWASSLSGRSDRGMDNGDVPSDIVPMTEERAHNLQLD